MRLPSNENCLVFHSDACKLLPILCHFIYNLSLSVYLPNDVKSATFSVWADPENDGLLVEY